MAGLYEAGIKPALWSAIVQRIRGLLEHVGVAFGMIHARQGPMPCLQRNFSPNCLLGVVARYHTPANNSCVKVAVPTKPLCIIPLQSVVRDFKLKRMNFYNGQMQLHKYWHGLLVSVYRDDDRLVGLASYRSAFAGSYDDTETAHPASLLPQLNRCLRVFLRLASSDRGEGGIGRLDQYVAHAYSPIASGEGDRTPPG